MASDPLDGAAARRRGTSGLEADRIGPFTPRVSQGGAAADGALHTGATAIVAHNDLLAIGVVQRLAQRSVRVPDDVSVVGFDDIFAADLCTPTLTTLGGAHAEVGRAAVEILLQISNQPAPDETRRRSRSRPSSSSGTRPGWLRDEGHGERGSPARRP